MRLFEMIEKAEKLMVFVGKFIPGFEAAIKDNVLESITEIEVLPPDPSGKFFTVRLTLKTEASEVALQNDIRVSIPSWVKVGLGDETTVVTVTPPKPPKVTVTVDGEVPPL